MRCACCGLINLFLDLLIIQFFRHPRLGNASSNGFRYASHACRVFTVECRCGLSPDDRFWEVCVQLGPSGGSFFGQRYGPKAATFWPTVRQGQMYTKCIYFREFNKLFLLGRIFMTNFTNIKLYKLVETKDKWGLTV